MILQYEQFEGICHFLKKLYFVFFNEMTKLSWYSNIMISIVSIIEDTLQLHLNTQLHSNIYKLVTKTVLLR